MENPECPSSTLQPESSVQEGSCMSEDSRKKRDTAESIRSCLAVLLILLTFFISAATLSFQTRNAIKMTSTRLPKALRPIHYDLTIEINPDVSVAKFTGSVVVTIECVQPTDTIMFHAAPALHMYSSHLSGGPFVLDAVRKRDVVTLKLDRKLEPSMQYQVSVKFENTYSSESQGFYSDHYNQNGRQRTVYVTQFEPHYARTAFPCFDEPAFKATFNITIIHANNLKARSNMPLLTSEPTGKHMVVDVFQKTPIMSSYIVAWFVSDFRFMTKGRVTVWGEARHVHAMNEVLDIATRGLEYCEEFFGIKYVLPKLDFVGIEKFHFGAMENWGLIVVRETNLFGDKKHRPAVTVILHEIIHQWLGNLITAKWWNDIWIQEAPAYYLSSGGSEILYPKRGYVLNLVRNIYDEHHASYERPTLFPENSSLGERHSLDIDKEMGFALHQRAHHLIRMIHNLLGDEEYRSTMAGLIKKYSYGNLDGYEFLETMTEMQSKNPKVDIEGHMTSWFESDGFPLVSLRRNYRSKTITIIQKPFNTTSRTIYHIPIVFADNRAQDILHPLRYEIHWLVDEHSVLPDPNDNETALLVNPGMIGYFLVHYDIHNWALIGQFLSENPNMVDLLTLSSLLEGAEMLYGNQAVSIDSVLWTWDSLRRVSDWVPWTVLMKSIARHDAYLVRLLDDKRYDARLLEIIERMARTRAFNVIKYSSDEERSFARTANNFLCSLNYNKCVDQITGSWRRAAGNISSYEDFEMWSNRTIDVNPDMALCVVVRFGSDSTCKTVSSWLSLATSAVRRGNIDIALTCCRNKSLVRRAIKDSLSRSADWTKLANRMVRQDRSFQEVFLGIVLDLSANDAQQLGISVDSMIPVAANYVVSDKQNIKLVDLAEKLLGRSRSSELDNKMKKVISQRAIDEEGYRYWLDHQIPPIT
ncbi:aminopeptidase Q-like [Ornithodoros turicata]|uniref:aminopeptidase Q-like n=1 Tax=Ornithodoros turicata TaxID=34597 RepID=UPI0031396D63